MKEKEKKGFSVNVLRDVDKLSRGVFKKGMSFFLSQSMVREGGSYFICVIGSYGGMRNLPVIK